MQLITVGIYALKTTRTRFFTACLKNSESLQNLDILLAHLMVEKCTELAELIKSYPSLFCDMPSKTHVIEHDINMGDAKPIC